MVYRRIIFVLVMVFYTLGIAVAQDAETEPHVIPLYYDLTASIDNNFDLDTLLAEVNTRLTEFALVVVPDPTPQGYLWTQSGITLFSSRDEDGEIQFVLEANNPTLDRLSPVLESRHDVSTSTVETLADILFALALYHHDSVDAAQRAFEALIASDEPNQFHYYLGYLALLEDDYPAALAHFDTTFTDFHAERVRVASSAAWALWQMGATDAAFERINTALDGAVTVSNEVVLMRSRAYLFALMLDYDAALMDIDAAIALAETHDFSRVTRAGLYTNRAELVFLIYEWDRVEENLDMALELDPTYAPAYFQRGVLFYTMARREDAIADFEMYLVLTPDGIYNEQATEYIESIEIELEALGG